MKSRQNDESLDPVRRRLLRLLAERRSNLRTASVAMGRNAAYLQQFVRRGMPKILAEDDRELLAAHLGCSPALLKHDRDARMEARRKRPPSDRSLFAPEGYVAVSEIDVRTVSDTGAWKDALAGTGDVWLFPEAFVRHELRASACDLWMITAEGDSMEPNISNGDRILADVGRTVPAPPGIFVIWDGMGLVARHLEHLPHSDPPRLVLRSPNPRYGDHERPAADVRVVGRVLWVGKKP